MSLREHLSKHRPDDPMYTFVVMTWELGNICRSYVRANHKGSSEAKAYLQEGRMALADLVTQCRLLAEEMDLDWDGLVTDGEEAFLERMKDIDNWVEGR